MSSVPQSATITAALLDRIIRLLAPLFLDATAGDLIAARDAARGMLASYNSRDDEELRLHALVIAFGFGALDALAQAAGSGLSLNQVMRLRSNATALSRAGHQNQAVLDRCRKQSAAEPAPEPEPAQTELPDSLRTADLVAFTRHGKRAPLALPPDETAPLRQAPLDQPRPPSAPAATPLTRQQRRAAEREAEKRQRRLDHQARKAALLMGRHGASAGNAPSDDGAAEPALPGKPPISPVSC